ncbi:MAG: bifunctional polysaccharide deacetylase/glycosyltransferase family 2 protein [Desulfurococcales archaeon]|nr:bifunctional polysaccharide deacetylase/glycosyltransferase family 2 protein [Desulfurococcales archaeon]
MGDPALPSRRALALSIACVALLLVATAFASVGSGLSQFQLPRYRAVSVRLTPYYGGADAALVFRVDDFVVDGALLHRLPDSIGEPHEWFENYELDLIDYVTTRYPWLRLTVGVITYCGGDCEGTWRLYETLVKRYGWEVASHSRYHVRPPRSPSDYLGSLSDIEERIPGYRVLTYIEPFGRASQSELEQLRAHGVRVFCTTTLEPPLRPDVEGGVLKLGFTVKASDKFPWHKWLSASIKLAEADGGVVVVYTHATSYDWRSPSDLLKAVDYIAREADSPRIWITTPGELYSYLEELGSASVSAYYEGSTLHIRLEGAPAHGAWRVPLTIAVDVGGARVVGVAVDGRPIHAVDATHLGKPRVGYFMRGGVLYISAVPPANITVTLSPASPATIVIPHSIDSGFRGLDRARLAAYLLWLPFTVILVSAYRRGRVVRIYKYNLRKRSCRRAREARYAVVIPARNSEDTIGDVLRAALAQSVRPVAVALLDDASSDGTVAEALRVLEEAGAVLECQRSEGARRILCYRLPWGAPFYMVSFGSHTGKSRMINYALEKVLSEVDYDYLLILDSDTLLERDYAERLLANMLGGPRYSATNGLLLLWRPDRRGLAARLIAGAFRNVGTAILTLGIRMIESAAGALGGLNGAALMIERGLLERLGGLPTGTTAEDAEVTWRAILDGYRVGVTPTAVAYTVDPGSLGSLARKTLRIATGTIESMLRVAPKLAARRRFKALFSVLYNSLGGIPLALSVIHLALVVALASLGLHPQGLALKLALLLPYTPLSLALLPLLESPLGYLAFMYAIGMGEASLLLVSLALIYYGEPRVSRRLLAALAYVPLFPAVLWLNTLILLAAIPRALYHYATGVHPDKW